MKHVGDLLAKHRNVFLIGLLAATLAFSGYVKQENTKAASVNIPVTEVAAQPLNALEGFRQQRDQSVLTDIAALEKLIALPDLDDNTRQEAAACLQSIIEARQAQSALEGALSGSSLSPCVTVVQNGSVTIVTDKSTITEKDSALVMTLAAAHTGASPENVRIIPAD